MPETAIPIVFRSKGAHTRLVKKMADKRTDDSGQIVSVQGEAIEFDGQGILEVEESDTALLSWLRGHSGFNKSFVEFGKVGSMGEQLPKAEDQIASIFKLQSARNELGLRRLIEDEKDSHDRAIIIQTAEEALRGVTGKQAKPSDPPALAAVEVEVPAPKPKGSKKPKD